MDRIFLALGSIFGFLGVASGAFAAHMLQERLDARHFQIWEVGARYQLYHALALVAVAWAFTRFSPGLTAAAGWCFVAGIVIFSGSLYLLALTQIRWLGAITPLGGMAFLIGWLLLTIAAFKR